MSGGHAFAKIIRKYYLTTCFFQFILNVFIKKLLAELYVSIFLITQILQQGILELVLYADLVIDSVTLLDNPFKKTINCYK